MHTSIIVVLFDAYSIAQEKRKEKLQGRPRKALYDMLSKNGG
jgi:hypothetical protein